MEEIARIFSIGIPVFAILVLSEKLYGHLKGNDTVPWMDALSSSYSGITFVVRILFGFGITIVSYEFMVEHLAITSIETTWLSYVVTFVVMDFQAYWGHRLVHEVNFLWNRHLIHHSSEEFNLACALRQSISDFVNFLFFLSIPAALLGLSPTVIAVVLPIHKFAQYWYHTRHIGNLGFLEHIIVTPSHHRVHHALNPIYLDKNYSAIFIFWDKLFGTFQKELESEPPVYGLTRPSQTYNPITINFEHLSLMVKDAWRTENWRDRLTIWLRPTGWRPKGFEEKYPVKKISEPYNFEKYKPQTSKALFIWSNIQFFTLFLFVIYVIRDIDKIGIKGLYLFGVFVFVQVYSATELMNGSKWALSYTSISTFICLGIYLGDHTFFGVDKLSTLLPFAFLAYFILQAIISFLFSRKQGNLSLPIMQKI
jgi:alkylglycerol monooxygenase